MAEEERELLATETFPSREGKEREEGREELPLFFYLRINALKMVLIYGKLRTFY